MLSGVMFVTWLNQQKNTMKVFKVMFIKDGKTHVWLIVAIHDQLAEEKVIQQQGVVTFLNTKEYPLLKAVVTKLKPEVVDKFILNN